MANTSFHHSLLIYFNILNICHKFTSLKSRIALQVARKIAPCDRALSLLQLYTVGVAAYLALKNLLKCRKVHTAAQLALTSLLITGLLQVLTYLPEALKDWNVWIEGLKTEEFSPTSLMQIILISCSKSANIKLYQQLRGLMQLDKIKLDSI